MANMMSMVPMAHDLVVEAVPAGRIGRLPRPVAWRVSRRSTRSWVGGVYAGGLCAAVLTAVPTAGPAWGQFLPAPEAGTGVYLGPGAGVAPRAADAVGLPPGPGNNGLPQFQGEGDVFDTPYGPAAAGGVPPPGFYVTPSAALTLYGTDNARTLPSGKHQGDFVTTFTPGLTATANTASVVGTLTYLPSFRVSAEQPTQNSIAQRFSANARVTLLPDMLFVNVTGFGALTETAGGIAPGVTNTTSPLLDRRNSVQTTSLQLSPYLVHRFSGYATAQAGYSFRYLDQSGQPAYLNGATTPFFTGSNTTTHTGYGIVRTGEYFGPVALEARVVGSTTEGSGALAGSHNYLGAVQGRYSFTRDIAGLLEGGYEDQRYGGTRPFTVQAPIWSVGTRITPTPDSFIILKYGQRDGYTSSTLNASVGVATRTRVFASYSDQIGTPVQRTADLLSTTAIDAQGNPYDTLAGAPTLPVPFVNSFLATQSSVLRIKRAIASVSQTWDRDTVSVNFTRIDNAPLTSAAGTVGFSQKGNSIGASWNHLLSPTLTSIIYLQYGRFDSKSGSAPSSTSDNYTVRLGLTERFSETLTGTLQYLYSNRGSDVVSSRTDQNIIIAGLRKTF